MWGQFSGVWPAKDVALLLSTPRQKPSTRIRQPLGGIELEQGLSVALVIHWLKWRKRTRRQELCGSRI
ncbi:hypothetical protein BOTBODRAFT_235531 [Botryobasidium botryosum FD-172 SS1]|uniref:Uncharacterized protein n=1 Tax=Botryobasidium botryosum (strain FD-172 SS1) TaxID=930990 RepID=A0A067M5A8_BOTB1|nr:hypothetical protein BOTBODRAFT_235531 [Botryobasidium botryosum FD-172 SS1]